MKAQVSLDTKIKPHDLVYYLGLEPAHHGRKEKSLYTTVVSDDDWFRWYKHNQMNLFSGLMPNIAYMNLRGRDNTEQNEF